MVNERPDLGALFSVAEVPAFVLVIDRRVVDRLDRRASAPAIKRMPALHLEPLVVEAAA